MATQLRIDSIRLDGGTQPRAAMNFVVIEEYAQAMLEGAAFPPVVVFYDGSDYWLADGFHRVKAAERVEWTEVDADVRQGSLRDAILYSVGANAAHGMRRSNEDKRRAVETLLRDAEWAQQGSGWIAAKCAVSDRFVRKIIEEMGLSRNDSEIVVHRNGTTYTMNTANIGERIAPEVRQAILQTAVVDDLSQLRMLERMEPERQEEVAARIVAGEAQSVAEARRQLRQEQAPDLPPPVGKYRAIVIDPPWPVQKILRDARPNQAEFDYPTMSLEEITALPVPALMDPGGCHVYLWVTQKHLPAGLRMFDAWGVQYQCLMTWVKNVGFTPFSWMYSTEHVLFGHVGSLALLKLGLRLDFAAGVREHSRKPDIFYQRVREASPGPRLDMFSRESREGFEQWGNETSRF